jgi:outer membrane protein assembly factor BamB
MRRLACLALFAAALPAVAADNWPEFRGPRGDGVADANGLPTTWGEGKNVRWKAAVHDKGWSSPVVWGDQVWVTTATERGTKYYALCFDRKTGAVVHDLLLLDIPEPTDIRQFNSYASPTPAVEDGRIYVHFGSFGTFCVDTATGNVLWKRLDLPCDHFRGPASSVVLHKDRMFLLFDGFDRQYVACLSKADGRTLWQKDRDLPYQNTKNPMKDNDYKKAFATASVFEVGGKAQVVCPAAMGTVAHDAETGAEVWRVITGGMNQAIRPVLADGLVYVSAGHPSGFLAVTAGRSGDLTKTGVVWRVDKTPPTRPSPVVVGGHLYMVNDTGIVFCLDAKTGKTVWQERLDGKFSASPVLAGGNLYFFNEGGKGAGKGFVIAAKPEYELVAENRLDAGCRGSPAVSGDAMFVRTDTHLYCIGGK